MQIELDILWKKKVPVILSISIGKAPRAFCTRTDNVNWSISQWLHMFVYGTIEPITQWDKRLKVTQSRFCSPADWCANKARLRLMEFCLRNRRLHVFISGSLEVDKKSHRFVLSWRQWFQVRTMVSDVQSKFLLKCFHLYKPQINCKVRQFFTSVLQTHIGVTDYCFYLQPTVIDNRFCVLWITDLSVPLVAQITKSSVNFFNYLRTCFIHSLQKTVSEMFLQTPIAFFFHRDVHKCNHCSRQMSELAMWIICMRQNVVDEKIPCYILTPQILF